MNGKISGLVKAAASVSLAGGILMAAAGPAAAASPNEAYGAEATGVVSLPPVAEATHPGVSPVTLATVNLGALLRADDQPGHGRRDQRVVDPRRHPVGAVGPARRGR